MELSIHPIQASPPAVSDASSPARLIEYGLQCAQQGNWREAEYFFQLAREQLSLKQQQFAPELDLFLQEYTSFVQAQQDLHKASKQFVQAESALQTQLLLLERLLPALRDDKDRGQEPTPTLTVTPLSPVGTAPCACPPVPCSCPSGACSCPTHPNGETAPCACPSEASSCATHPNVGTVPCACPSEASSCSIPPTKDRDNLPSLSITCFGHFEVRRSDQAHKPLLLCQNRNGQAILRILVAQSGYCASADMLMDILWRNNPPSVARRKLQVAISALRCSLNNGLKCDPGSGYILCKDQHYQLNPAISIVTDVTEFLALWEAGRQLEGQTAIELYEKACNLRTGPFLIEDLYADWSSLLREQLNQTYLTMCQARSDYYLKIERYDEAIKWTNALLKENRYDERAYRQLMRIYATQGRRCEALRQYQFCERILKEDLGIAPMPETVEFFQMLLKAGEIERK